ncbi:MAG TPA: ThiF family adenylyltransferase [Natronosporangium sp.]
MREHDEVHLIHHISKRRFRLSAPAQASEHLAALLDTMRSGVQVDESGQAAATALAGAGCEPALARSVLGQLDQIGALVREAGEPVRPNELYERQVRFFRLFEDGNRTAAEMMERLQSAKVAVVGLGGQGSWLLFLLARIGVRSLVGVDGDVVERSNLSRQVLYDESDIGRPKVLAARRAVHAIDPSIDYQSVNVFVRTVDDLLPHLSGCDLVVNPFGYVPNRSLEVVDDAAWVAGVPSIVLGGSWVGPFRIGPGSPCYRCLLADPAIWPVINASQGSFVGRGADDAAGGPFAPRLAATGAVAANEVALYLSGARRPRSADGVVVLDLFDFDRTHLRTVEVAPGCRCARGRSAASRTGGS